MSIKDKLLKLKETTTEVSQKESNTIDLDDKVDAYMDWYFNTLVKGHYTHIGEYHIPKDMRNFIEKMAVWYELRYPDYEINNLMYCCGLDSTNINEIMFKDNPYINDLVSEESDIKNLNWSEFYNFGAFVKSLPWEERCIFVKPRYRSTVLFDPKFSMASLHLTKNGIVKYSNGVFKLTKGVIENKDLKGLHIKDVIKLFQEKGITLPLNELEDAIKDVDNWIYQKEEMLNCVMYRIIERGGNRIGPRRAFLFAKEFGKNIDIPMMYAVDRTDPGLRLFMNEYIKAGGKSDLECYVGYFSRTSKDDKLNTISIQDLILTQPKDAVTFYTSEEDELHQRLVNVIRQMEDEQFKKEAKQKLANKNQ